MGFKNGEFLRSMKLGGAGHGAASYFSGERQEIIEVFLLQCVQCVPSCGLSFHIFLTQPQDSLVFRLYFSNFAAKERRNYNFEKSCGIL
jgi:hypothetical protein